MGDLQCYRVHSSTYWINSDYTLMGMSLVTLHMQGIRATADFLFNCLAKGCFSGWKDGSLQSCAMCRHIKPKLATIGGPAYLPHQSLQFLQRWRARAGVGAVLQGSCLTALELQMVQQQQGTVLELEKQLVRAKWMQKVHLTEEQVDGRVEWHL